VKPLSAEQTALLSCVHIDRPLAGLPADIEWAQVGSEAQRHAILPLVCHALSQAATSCPSPLLREWQVKAVRQRLANLRRCAELLALQQAMEKVGIAFLVFKGPVAAMVCFRDVGLRSFLDLDVLVRPEDAAPAMAVLRQRGYQPVFPLPRRWEQRTMLASGELTFVRPSTGDTVDLHCRLLPAGYSFAADPPDLWQRSEQVKIGGGVVTTLNGENTLVFLGLHAAKHDWGRLSWLCDIAYLVARRELDWDLIQARLKAWRCQVLVQVGLLLARTLLGAPLPKKSMPLSPSTCRRVERLAEQAVQTRLFAARSAGAIPSWPWQLLFFRGMQQPRDRWQMIYETFFRPSALELAMMPLPLWTEPLYAIVRPLRLLAKHGRAWAAQSN
jgi:hypothetical protein